MPDGRRVHMHIAELGVDGFAQVVNVKPAPAVQYTDGASTITAVYRTTNTTALDLYLQGVDEPIGVTDSHPFWSVDREDWVRAGELHECERIQGSYGIEHVASIETRTHNETVYNLEVYGDNTYYVGDVQLWVHNANTCIPRVSAIDDDWIKKGAHIHIAGFEFSIRPNSNASYVIKHTYGHQQGKSGAAQALALAEASLGDPSFRSKLRDTVSRAVGYFRSNGLHDKAYEMMMLEKALK